MVLKPEPMFQCGRNDYRRSKAACYFNVSTRRTLHAKKGGRTSEGRRFSFPYVVIMKDMMNVFVNIL